MNKNKGKVPVGMTSTIDGDEPRLRPKVVWDKEAVKNFIDGALEQVNKWERNGTSLSKKGWAGLAAYLKFSNGRDYDKQQLKNKWDNLKKDWVPWYTLFKNVTSLGWNNDKHTFDASDEWWNAKEMENPAYGKYRRQGLLYAREMTYIFKDQVATGEYAWTPFFEELDDEGHDDAYAIGPQNLGMDTNEGSGDSEDPTIGASNPNIGVGSSMGIGNINLNSSQSYRDARSGEKRKSCGGKRKGKKGRTNTEVIGQHLDNVAMAVSSHTSAIMAQKEGQDIGTAMAALIKVPGVVEDAAFYDKCCEVFLNPSARQVFLAIPDPEIQYLFLKSMADKL